MNYNFFSLKISDWRVSPGQEPHAIALSMVITSSDKSRPYATHLAILPKDDRTPYYVDGNYDMTYAEAREDFYRRKTGISRGTAQWAPPEPPETTRYRIIEVRSAEFDVKGYYDTRSGAVIDAATEALDSAEIEFSRDITKL